MMQYSSGFEEIDFAIPSYSSRKYSEPSVAAEESIKPAIPPSAELFVRNLPVDIEKAEVENLFRPFGKCFVKLSKNAVFVCYESPLDAEAALKKMDNTLFEKSVLSIQYAKQRNTSSSCLICGREGKPGANLIGHWAKSCPDNKDQSLDVKSGKCFRCGEVGHLAKFCGSLDAPPAHPVSRYHRERDHYGYTEREPQREYQRSRPAYNYADRPRSPRREHPRYDRYADRYPPRDNYGHYSNYEYDYRRYPDDDYRPYHGRDRYGYDRIDYRQADYHDHRR